MRWFAQFRKHPTLPPVDVRRDMATLARWWPLLVLGGVVLAGLLLAASGWVWYRAATHALPLVAGGPTPQLGAEEGALETDDLEQRRIQRVLRELNTALSAFSQKEEPRPVEPN
ncbi:MAG: hypothetical protein KatS3mg099_273 [Candidatus Parcubacteria bacterium]|nr:MAG: hypothetical protein KatS3mg099_273 [Candidatus Parcubacteria bacterium]